MTPMLVSTYSHHTAMITSIYDTCVTCSINLIASFTFAHPNGVTIDGKFSAAPQTSRQSFTIQNSHLRLRDNHDSHP